MTFPLIDNGNYCPELQDNYSLENLTKETHSRGFFNLYENKIDSHEWGSTSPMTHKGSYDKDFVVNKQHEPYLLDKKLSTTRQKEGQVLVSWLYKKISTSNNDHGYQVKK